MNRKCECYRHHCRTCGREFYIRKGSSEYPKCCGSRMAYLGIVMAVPGPAADKTSEPQDKEEAS